MNNASEISYSASQTLPYTNVDNYNYYMTDFNNVFKMTINKLWYNKVIKQFLIQLPTQIDTVIDNYCNATVTGFSATIKSGREPNPPPLECYVHNDPSGGKKHFISLKVNPLQIAEEVINKADITYDMTVIIKINFNSTSKGVSLECPASCPATPADCEKCVRAYALAAFIDPVAHPSLLQATPFDNETLVSKLNFTSIIDGNNQIVIVSSYSQPELAYVTFNRKSFNDRKAVIAAKDIEYYMIYAPKINQTTGQITRLVFTLPTEFGYPPVKYLDNCQRIGYELPRNPFIVESYTPDNVDDCFYSCCKLERFAGIKNVTMKVNSSNYNHQINIVRIARKQGLQQFEAPNMPGTHYKMQVHAYGAGNQLLEYCRTDVSNVQGLQFKKLDKHNNTIMDIKIIGYKNT